MSLYPQQEQINGDNANESVSAASPAEAPAASTSVVEPSSKSLNGTTPEQHRQSLSTLAIHADDALNTPGGTTDVAPALHVSTTFHYTRNVDELCPVADEDLDMVNPAHVYSRVSNANTTRLERILTALLGASSLTYASGLAAFMAMLVRLRPNVIAITDGYHGCHGVIDILVRLYGLKVVPLDDLDAWKQAGLGKGDVVHVETPLNPTGEALELAKYSRLAHERGAYLTVDATFAPPPLQDPFAFGADVVMHSGTKYLGGHSDMLCGVLATRHEDLWKALWAERLHLGSVMGSFEGWLGVRSVRTLELRVRSQSENAARLVQWLHACISDNVAGGEVKVAAEDKAIVRRLVSRVQHASLQALHPEKASWITSQMPNGYGPVFAIWTHEREQARRLPSKLHLFHHATSLGGVESLIEWRRMSDAGVDERLLRVSIGIESWQDLRRDLLRGFEEVVADLAAK